MATAEKLLSVEEFLAWEKAQPERYEYVAGSIYAMAGMSDEHNQLSTNLVTACATALKPPCRVRTEGLKVQIGASFFYPDALILCSPPLFCNTRRDTILNPTVVFEILSESTEAFDRGEKFRRYRSLPGLKAIVFVSQDRVLVECWSRKDDAWQVQEWESLTDSLPIPPLDIEISLAALYDGLEFPDPE
jgi:Uma2 family endonuclease